MPNQNTSITPVGANLERVRKRIAQACQRAGRSPEQVTVVAVSKGVLPEAIKDAYHAGIRHFGESRVQEIQGKWEQLLDLEPRPVWHFIGHLQTNKVVTALRLFDIIQSIDSVKLAEALNQRAQSKIPVLLEVNLAEEASKSGFLADQVKAALQKIQLLPQLEVSGLMTVAPQVYDPEEVRPFFRQMNRLAKELELSELSMGMSDDFEVAIEEGATIVRLGRVIFGASVNR